MVTLFGPFMLMTTAMTMGALHLLERIESHPDMAVPKMPPMFELAVAFCDRSKGVLAALGVVMLIAGLIALRDPRRGRRPLQAAAWFTVAVMVVLGGLWSLEAATLSLSWAHHAVGVVIHGVQALAVVKAALFLGRSDLARACDAGPASS